MNKKSLISITVALTMLLSMFAAGSVSSVQLDQTTFKVGIVYSTGGLGDLSFNDAAKRGIEAAKTTHGSSLTVEEACGTGCDTITKVTEAIIAFGDDGSFDLVIGIGFSAADGVSAAANATLNANGTTNYMIIDSVVDLSNVASITFKEQEGSFLAGAMAAMVTKTNKLGFLGGLRIPLIDRFGAGFEHGAKYINPDIEVLVTYSPDPNNPWGDIDGGRTVGETFLDQGADVIYAAAGGTGIGMFDAVEAWNNETSNDKAYGIGVDSDQDYLSEGNVLTSMIKKVDVAVENNIADLISGDWEATVQNLGLAEDGVDISEMEFTQDVATGDFGDQTRQEIVDEIKADIIAGDIVVAETFEEVDAIEFTGAAYTSDSAPFAVVPFFFSMFALVAIIRRLRK